MTHFEHIQPVPRPRSIGRIAAVYILERPDGSGGARSAGRFVAVWLPPVFGCEGLPPDGMFHQFQMRQRPAGHGPAHAIVQVTQLQPETTLRVSSTIGMSDEDGRSSGFRTTDGKTEALELVIRPGAERTLFCQVVLRSRLEALIERQFERFPELFVHHTANGSESRGASVEIPRKIPSNFADHGTRPLLRILDGVHGSTRNVVPRACQTSAVKSSSRAFERSGRRHDASKRRSTR